MSEDSTKTCGMCGMDIPDKAKKCPHCHQWQYKSSMIMYHPLLVGILVVVMFFPMFFILSSMQQEIFKPGAKFSEHKQHLTIDSAELKFGIRQGAENENSKTAVVLGELKNASDVGWDDIVLEVQFFDKDGELTDTNQKRCYYLMVPAQGRSAYKVSTLMEFPEEEYASTKVIIKTAKDQSSRF